MDGRIECPGCGIWADVKEASFQCRNPTCAFSRPEHAFAVRLTKKWGALNTLQLIQVGSWRYFMPRAWNGGRPWISWTELSEKYEEYKKEKMSCL
jgi:hypothetical protein